MSQPVDPVRSAAVYLVNRVTEDRKLLSELLPQAVSHLAPPERARAQRLAIDTLRWADRADRMLGPYLRLKPYEYTLNVLRLGVVEICQHKSAAHGVVNDLVSITAAHPKVGKASGLVNAVLRKIARETDKWDKLPLPKLPKWLRKPLVADYGKQVVEAFEQAFAAGASIDVTPKADDPALATKLNATVLPTGTLRLPQGAEVTRLPGYETGDWWVQDAAAALPARVLAAKPGENILDMCAAPGGKTMQLAAAGAHVTALDISEKRYERVRQNLERTGLKATVVAADALEFSGGPFDAILLDAPCSATGTIRRHPDLSYAKNGEDFPGLFALQLAMIDRAMTLLRPGGRLVYCTCSLLWDEGEEQIKDLLERDSSASLDLDALRFGGISPEWIGPFGLRTRPDYWPELGGMDGFFLSVIRKN